MKEKLYTIPVNDAFNEDCECPLCHIYNNLESDAIDFTLGPSYMEEDIRQITDKEGFCEKHLEKLYKKQNNLGLANILKTHLYNKIKELEKLSNHPHTKNVLFKKNKPHPLTNYLQKHNKSCFICNKINKTFERYIATIIYLYKNDPNFYNKLTSSKGFCLKHYEMLYTTALNTLNGKLLDSFICDINKITIIETL